MKRQFFVVANPASGNSKKLDHILNELVDFFSDNKLKYEVFLTQKSGNAWKTVAENLDSSFTDLVVIGGDGTINEAINGLKHDIPVSVISNGTGNDYIKMLNIGKTLAEQIQVLARGRIIAVDVGVCNGRKFLNGVGVGFDGQIVADMLGKKSILAGPAKYYYHVLSILATYKSRLFNYQVDSTKKSKDLILLCVAKGSTFGGSFVLTPDAKLDDGKLHVCEIGRLSGISRFLNIHKLQGGTHGSMKAVSLYSCDKLSIEANSQLHAHIDGEAFGQPPFEFSVLKSAVRFRVKG
ncbi:MAG: diacylglycerol kinase family lipid kinase [Cyclobacteriaceae bacterium]